MLRRYEPNIVTNSCGSRKTDICIPELLTKIKEIQTSYGKKMRKFRK